MKATTLAQLGRIPSGSVVNAEFTFSLFGVRLFTVSHDTTTYVNVPENKLTFR